MNSILYFQGLASQILWIIPTFIGKIPIPQEKQDISAGLLSDISNHLDPADDRWRFTSDKSPHYICNKSNLRLLGLTENLANAPVEKNWNRLMSLQGVFANICINILNVSYYSATHSFQFINLS